jgi:tRNA-Thr(GGU) m(6)t(6)A37 methyltransferase TsaA
MNLQLEPIGILHGQRSHRFLAPRQPGQAPPEACARIDLVAGRHLDAALCDLAGFSRIWLVWWFHKNPGWRPKVLPPRGRSGRKGVLATRSPHRPNPLGISAVPLLGVEGHTLWVGQHDLLDGTPILDIKPYLPSVDSFPEEREGWLEAPAPRPYEVRLTPAAQQQMDYLVGHYHPEFARRVLSVLQADPHPLKSRRICKMPQGYRLGCGPWRVFYQLYQDHVLIERVSDDQGGWPGP